MEGADPYASIYDDPSLFIRCADDDLDVFIHWGGRFLADSSSTDSIPTRYRVDAQPAVTTSSGESTNNEAAFLQQPTQFADKLLNANAVVIRVTDFDGEQMTARFAVNGLASVRDSLACWR